MERLKVRGIFLCIYAPFQAISQYSLLVQKKKSFSILLPFLAWQIAVTSHLMLAYTGGEGWEQAVYFPGPE